MSNRDRYIRWGLLLVVAGGAVLRVWSVFYHNPLDAVFSDPARWWESGYKPLSLGPMTGIDPVGYQIWASLVAKLSAGYPPLVAASAAILSLLTPYVWYRYMLELAPRGWFALITWAVISWLPSYIAIFSYFMTETLFIVLFGAALWLSFRAMRLGTLPSFLLSVLVWLAASVTRIFALPIGIIVSAWVLFHSEQRKRKIIAAGALALVFLLPLAARCYYLTGVWSPFGVPQMNRIYFDSGRATIQFDIRRDQGAYNWYYEFTSPVIYDQPLHPLSDWSSSRTGIAKFTINEDRGLRDWNEADAALSAGRQRLLRLYGANYLLFYFGRSWPDDDPERFLERVNNHLRWIWAPLLLVVTIWNARQIVLTRTVHVVQVITMVLCWLMPLAPVLIEGRYRKGAEALLITNLLFLAARWREDREYAKAVKEPQQVHAAEARIGAGSAS
jgi:hypothetical protein